MKIVSIYSEMPNQGLSDVMKVVYKTLHELNVNVEEINLKYKIPFYEGIKIKEVTDIILKIHEAEACILATSVNMFAPTALMKAFLEHCTHVDYQAVLMGKSYMTVSVSNSVGERDTSEYLYRVINILGGTELGRIAIGGRDLSFINTDEGIIEAVERSTEDFYRLIRQNRRPFMSSEAYMYRNYFNDSVNSNSTVLKPVYTQPAPIYSQETKPTLQPKSFTPYEQEIIDNTKQDFEDIKALLDTIRSKAEDNPKDKHQPASYTQPGSYQPPHSNDNFEVPLQNNKSNEIEAFQSQFDTFNQRQQEDIDDITKMFAQKKPEEIEMPVNNVTYQRPFVQPQNQEVVYREKTCEQMLISLPHYFQSQLAVGLNIVFQFNISGDETIEGYLTIANSETNFVEGIAPKADVYIYTTASVMKDVLRGKYSSQKAFMTGQLKVRGNFVLLNKLDQLYKKMP